MGEGARLSLRLFLLVSERWRLKDLQVENLLVVQ